MLVKLVLNRIVHMVLGLVGFVDRYLKRSINYMIIIMNVIQKNFLINMVKDKLRGTKVKLKIIVSL